MNVICCETCKSVFERDENFLVCLINFRPGEKFIIQIHTRCPTCDKFIAVPDLPKNVQSRVMNSQRYYFTFAPCFYIKNFNNIKVKTDKLRICGVNLDACWWEKKCLACKQTHIIDSPTVAKLPPAVRRIVEQSNKK
jgi:hypothetical protein